MKKIIILLLALILCSFVIVNTSCGKKNNAKDDKTQQNNPPKENDPPTDNPGNQNPPADNPGGNEDLKPKENKLGLTIPASSTVFDKEFAKLMLTICTGHEKLNSKVMLENCGFNCVLQKHFEKSEADSSHTSAFSVGVKKEVINEVERNVICITVRGTVGGEWISNFDFAGSIDENTHYAENFLKASQDIYNNVKPIITPLENPIILIAGHSRGAACANLLGVLYDEEYDNKDVFVYTFATPRTVRNLDKTYNNIFNVINSSDLVTEVPLASLGYVRAGIDLVGNAAPELSSIVTNSLNVCKSICPSITSYYKDKHNLYGAGLSVDGMSAYQFMVYLLSLGATMMSGTMDMQNSPLAKINMQSDFYPVVMLIGYFLQNGYVEKFLNQHMPQTYGTILKDLVVE